MHPINAIAPLISKAKNKQILSIPEESLWLENYISHSTKKTYKNAVISFAKFAKVKDFEEFIKTNQALVLSWRNELIESGASNRTINNKLSALSSLFDHLCDKQLVQTNPVKGLKRPKVNQKKIKTPSLTPEQVQTILSLPDTSKNRELRDWALLHVLFYTGCREGAIHKLKIGDFYLRSGYFVLDIHEKGEQENVVAIHHKLQAALRYYLANIEHGNEQHSPMFLNSRPKDNRTPLSTINIRYIFKKYLKKAAIPNYEKYSVHSARATFITEALRNNCPVEDVQKTVTHANVSTTLMYDTRSHEPAKSASFKVDY